MRIEIKYDGKFPNLCVGNLLVTVDDQQWDFGTFALYSGGNVLYTDKGKWEIKKDEWAIRWPTDFPNRFKKAVAQKINETIEHGCCGGCL